MSLPIQKSDGFHFFKFFQCPEQACGRILPATKNNYCFFHCTFLHSFYFRGDGFEPSAENSSVNPDNNILRESTTSFHLKIYTFQVLFSNLILIKVAPNLARI